MEIRLLTPDDVEQINYLVAVSLGGNERDAYLGRGPSEWPVDAYGAFEAGRLHAMAHIARLKAVFGERSVLPMGGIADVASLPASRGRGYAAQCMLRCLQHMRDTGLVVSTLFPFSYAWYRKLGWEWIGQERCYTVAASDLPSGPETECVRLAGPDDRDSVVAVYARFARRYRGMVDRYPAQWDHLLSDSSGHFTNTYLYEGDSGPEGYLTHRGRPDDPARLRDFVALTPAAYRGLLGLLKRHAMQVRRFAWTAPGDDALWFLMPEPRTHTEVRPVTQGRIVDVAGAFAAWKPDPSVRGEVTVAVADEHADWNQGTWRFEFEAGEARAARTTSEPQVTIDIRQLSQAFHGTPTLDKVRSAGQVAVHDEAGYVALRDLLAGPPMWMNDHF